MDKQNKDALLTERFGRALLWATELHNTQTRKGTSTPYIAHLLAVTAIVLENGGDEDEAIAALLHDAVEDQGGRPILNKIKADYGERVAKTVADLSDSWTEEKPPWEERKRKYLQELPSKSKSTLIVSLADKLHNVSSIVNDYKTHGEKLWDRFNAPKDKILWYYMELANIYKQTLNHPLVYRFDTEVKNLASLVED